VAVEKLAHSEFAKIGSRQEALQTIFTSLLDIFYHLIFDFFQKNRLFQRPHMVWTHEVTCPVNAASSTGRCNTIQRINSTMLPAGELSVWLYSVKT